MEKVNIEAAMGRYQQEVVRWNRQINLVSRKGTFGLVAALIRQCRDAFAQLAGVELGEPPVSGALWYFDLGSGGGLPGYVWHHELSERGSSLSTWLVEPREKRAWFLERLNQVSPERPIGVLAGLWGEHVAGVDEMDVPELVLISLKALRLSDVVVLEGLARTLKGAKVPVGCRILIARFYPPGQEWCEELEKELAPLDGRAEFGSLALVPAGQGVLGPQKESLRPASLVISRYEISQ